VEVVPENDILQFEDPEDLRILSAIYGLSAEGEETDLRERLMAFAKAHGDSAFVWWLRRPCSSSALRLRCSCRRGVAAQIQ